MEQPLRGQWPVARDRGQMQSQGWDRLPACARLSGPGLLCTDTGLPRRRNNTAECSAGGQTDVRAPKSTPGQAARLETRGAEGKSGPDCGAEQGGGKGRRPSRAVSGS